MSETGGVSNIFSIFGRHDAMHIQFIAHTSSSVGGPAGSGSGGEFFSATLASPLVSFAALAAASSVLASVAEAADASGDGSAAVLSVAPEVASADALSTSFFCRKGKFFENFFCV